MTENVNAVAESSFKEVGRFYPFLDNWLQNADSVARQEGE